MENWILNLFGFVYMIISELQAPNLGRLFYSRITQLFRGTYTI